ncbi:MAG TPA: hypothetical protein VI078_07570 [bacterium]
MRSVWVVLCCLVALGATGASAADGGGDADTEPSLEYRPPKPVLPEPKGPTPAPPVTVFQRSFGSFGIGGGSFDGPLDAAVGGKGNVFVLDGGNTRVQMFTDRDRFVLEWGSYGTDETRAQFRNPTGIVVVPESCSRIDHDVVLVIDTGNNRIQWFKVPCTGDPTKLSNLPVGDARSVFATFQADFGYLGDKTGGISDGKFNRPVDVAFDEWVGTTIGMWVLDAGNERIQHFTLDFNTRKGTFEASFVEKINDLSGSRGDLKGLVSLAWSHEGAFDYLYLLGTGCSIQKFKLQNIPVLDAAWPAVAPESDLCVPARVRYDSNKEYVYVLDSGNSLLSIFHRGGNFIGAIRGADRPFNKPAGVNLTPDTGTFVVADTGNDLVQKFTLR